MIAAKGDNGGYMGGLGHMVGVVGVVGCGGLKRCVIIDSLSIFLSLFFIFSTHHNPPQPTTLNIHIILSIIITSYMVVKKRLTRQNRSG